MGRMISSVLHCIHLPPGSSSAPLRVGSGLMRTEPPLLRNVSHSRAVYDSVWNGGRSFFQCSTTGPGKTLRQLPAKGLMPPRTTTHSSGKSSGRTGDSARWLLADYQTGHRAVLFPVRSGYRPGAPPIPGVDMVAVRIIFSNSAGFIARSIASSKVMRPRT